MFTRIVSIHSFKIQIIMRVSEFNRDSSRSPIKDKENYYGCSIDMENLRAMVLHNEQVVSEMRKEIRQKVNKTEFLSAMAAKVSLSDLTSLGFGQGQERKTEHYQQFIEEKVQEEMKNSLHCIRFEQQKWNEGVSTQIMNLRSQMSRIESICKKGSAECLKELRQGNQSLFQTLQKKAQRSQMDKMHHLSSLLAIQFQLIKKRFSTFQVDYNMVWKEISNLYENHESLRSVFQTERKESSENTREKQLQVLLQTSKGNCAAKLFGEREEGTKSIDINETQQTIVQFHQKIQQVEHMQNDHQYTLSNFSDRLASLEKDYEEWLQCVKEITRLKREYNDSKIEIGMLEKQNRKMKEEIKEMVREECKVEMKEVGKGINEEIQEACEEITNKMLQLFSECARANETDVLRNTISNVEEGLINRITLLQENCKKRMETQAIKHEQTQDKVRLISKELGNRLRIDEFQQTKQQLITAQASQTLLKKSENALKKEIHQFKESQKLVNEVVCSQTILARWIWISGEVRGGNLISWDKQSINTLPENFIYNQSDHTFKIASSGIYKIEMGFYAKKKPSIQIIINGKTIVSAVNNSSYVVHHSSGKLKDITNSEIAGLTYYDYYTLQENTRLAIAYTGEVGHGFFGIQRL